MSQKVMTSNRHSWIARVAILVLLVGQVIFVTWALKPPALAFRSTSHQPVAMTAPIQALPLTLETGQSTAANMARTWKANARLVSAVMRVEWTEDTGPTDFAMPSGGWVVYLFDSGESTLSLYLDRRTGALITSATGESGEGQWETLDFNAFPRKSTTALLTANVLEGASYRGACPATRSSALVALWLAPDGAGATRATWTVTYGDSRFEGTHDVVVQLDATSGNVTETERRDRPC